jgi:glycogen operon protein
MMPPDERTPGSAAPVFPLGAHLTEHGARFAVAASAAEAVELCLVDEDPDGGPPAERRIELPSRTFGIWHGTVPGLSPGQRYGYRVHGEYQPKAGQPINPAKLLVDPYARAISGTVTDLDAALGYLDDPLTGRPNPRDSLGSVPLSVLTSPVTTPVERPDVPWADTVVYELHVRGFTATHPDVPEHLRGTYLGLAHPAVTDHLRRLGVTAVELLPVHAFTDEPGLVRSGRHNYWGYATLGFFAPHPGYASRPGEEVAEFAAMVAELHRCGIEVILDVVYNHTGEGGLDGPTLSMRGLDSRAYYVHGLDGRMVDVTGCGNTLDAGSPTAARLVCDSLRYWASLGVDGFRFDLASVLGRPHAGGFDPNAGLLTMITCDPVLAERKLIAEPWDATAEGYRVGGFGVQWSEWNGRYRDAVRDFWRGHGHGVAELASRLTGSSDLYGGSGRRPWASVNFVTAHDGFTLRDLVSYRDKHNLANGEHNRDGTDDNRSQNFGVEGDTADPLIADARLATARGLLATLLLSTGTPMLTAGDERWRTQGGNNNAYCQDGPISWLDWSSSPEVQGLTEFTARVLRLRRFLPGRDRFFDHKDVVWWHPEGRPFGDADWHDGALRTIGVQTPGGGLLVLHGGPEPIDYTLPDVVLVPLLDNHSPTGIPAAAGPLPPGDTLSVAPRSLLLLTELPG